jgi:hypothetical protein
MIFARNHRNSCTEQERTWQSDTLEQLTGPVLTLQVTIKERTPLRGHDTEATDRVIDSVLQQLSTDLESAHFVSPGRGPARLNDCIA